jgi:hypothetical protein
MSLGLIISPKYRNKLLLSTLASEIDHRRPDQIVFFGSAKGMQAAQTIVTDLNIHLSIVRRNSTHCPQSCIAFLGSDLQKERNALQIINRLREQSCPVDVYFDNTELIRLRSYHTQGSATAQVHVMIYSSNQL